MVAYSLREKSLYLGHGFSRALNGLRT